MAVPFGSAKADALPIRVPGRSMPSASGFFVS